MRRNVPGQYKVFETASGFAPIQPKFRLSSAEGTRPLARSARARERMPSSMMLRHPHTPPPLGNIRTVTPRLLWTYSNVLVNNSGQKVYRCVLVDVEIGWPAPSSFSSDLKKKGIHLSLSELTIGRSVVSHGHYRNINALQFCAHGHMISEGASVRFEV